MIRKVACAVGALLLAAACGGSAGGGSAGGGSASAPSGQKATCANKDVKIAVPVTPPNVVHLPPYVALDMGIFKSEGLNVSISTFEGGVGAFRAVASGSIGLAGTSSEPFITAAAEGAEVKAVYSYAPNVDVSFVVGPDIKKPSDLKGKRIGIQEPSGFADVMSRLVLQKYGISPNDVRFVSTSTAGRVSELVAGHTDTAVLHVDQTQIAQQKAPGLHPLANLWQVVTGYQYSVWAASTNLIKNDPATLECTVRALVRADRAMYDTSKREQILTIAAKYTKEDPAIIASTYDQLVKARAWPENQGIPAANINGTVKSLAQNKQISSQPKYGDLVDSSFADKVVGQLGKVSTAPY